MSNDALIRVLRQDADRLDGGAYLDDVADEIERLRARIKELEANRFDLLDRLSALTGEADLVFIPAERIDKAWAKIQTRAEPVYHQGMERSLEIIGIVDDGEGGWRMSDD